MKKLLFKYFVLIFLFPITSIHAQNTWEARTDMPVVRLMPATFTIGNYAYLFGGENAAYYSDLWAYDPVADSWTQMATSPGVGRRGSMAFVLNDDAYIGGGQTINGYTSAFESYDPDSNIWTVKDTLPFGMRAYGIGFSINGKGYMGGGYITSLGFKDFWEYDPILDTWTAKADCYDKVYYAGSFAIGSKGYVVGGYNSTLINIVGTTYDPITDTWTRIANFPTYRSKAGAFASGNYGYIVCGEGYSSAFTVDYAFVRYDPATDTWTELQYFPFGRTYPYAFSVQGRIFAGGGANYAGWHQKDLFEYIPDTTTTGITDIRGKRFLVWPNPTTSIIHLPLENISSLSVFSMDGSIHHILVDQNGKADLSELSPGRYILKVDNKISSVIVQ